MFQIGDYIVYGTSGVCRVEKIGPVDLPDVSKDKLYYTLSPVRNPGGHIYTPVDNQRVVMRPILTEDETEQLRSLGSSLHRLSRRSISANSPV